MLKTPKEYIDTLKDNRTVFYAGEKVKDVTEHPFMRICIDWMAMDYSGHVQYLITRVPSSCTGTGSAGDWVGSMGLSISQLMSCLIRNIRTCFRLVGCLSISILVP